ncbi:MAG: U32 family peptidase C-terminal domain-containing protein, partial [Desulfobacterales bacterium]
TGRSGNRGLCAHPCRWRYAVLEQMRPGQYMPVAEDEHGTYLFSAADLCMIDYLPELIASGVSSLKIEGRMKGIHYLATVVNVYRQAIDAWYASPDTYAVKPEWVRALSGINSRGFSTGFYFGEPGALLPGYRPDAHGSDQRFLGKIVGPAPEGNGAHIVDVRNTFEADETVEILRRHERPKKDTVLAIQDAYGLPTGTAKPGEQVVVAFKHAYDAHDMIRRRQA